MMMTFITQGGEGQGNIRKKVEATKAKAEAEKRGLVARSCARSGRKDVVGEVKGIEMMDVLVAGRGARERGVSTPATRRYRWRRVPPWSSYSLCPQGPPPPPPPRIGLKT